jgi:uncharacterized protein YjbI with pentapeptide repeats
MTREIKNEIFKQMIIQITSREILFSPRFSHVAIFDSANLDSANSDSANLNSANFDWANFDWTNSDINLIIRSRDIYNIKAQLRRNNLDSMTSVQALMHQLVDED